MPPTQTSDTTPRGALVPPAGWLPRADDAGRPVGALFLTAVTLLALALRLLRLGGPSLWIDESFTWAQVEPGRGLEFWTQILEAYQGPLYHAVAWFAVRVEPTAEDDQARRIGRVLEAPRLFVVAPPRVAREVREPALR